MRRAAGLALLGLGMAGWEAQRRADARAIAADPETAELAHPVPGRPLTVESFDGTRLHVQVFGREGAPTIVLAHGWTCSIDFWHYQLRDLADEFRLVAYDQRGHGRSQASRDGEYSTQTLGDDLHAVIEACVPAGQRCVVAGHSMGGMTIAAWAGAHPDAVRDHVAAAALIDTGMGDLARQVLVLNPAWAHLLHNLVAPYVYGSTAALPKRTTPLSYRATRYVALQPDARPAHVAFTARMFNDTAPDTRGGYGRIFPKLDLYDDVSKLDVPTVVMVGERDRLTPPWHARRIAEVLPQLEELVEIPGVGHMAPLEAADLVTDRLRRLARAHLPSSRPSPNVPANDPLTPVTT